MMISVLIRINPFGDLARERKERQVMGENRNHASIVIKDQETSVIEDSYLVAALVTLDPSITYSPIVEAGGKVLFRVHGKISDDMGRLYAGEAASLAMYISNLKACRSAIFALRNSGSRSSRNRSF